MLVKYQFLCIHLANNVNLFLILLILFDSNGNYGNYGNIELDLFIL